MNLINTQFMNVDDIYYANHALHLLFQVLIYYRAIPNKDNVLTKAVKNYQTARKYNS